MNLNSNSNKHEMSDFSGSETPESQAIEVVLPDGRRNSVPEGAFRSLEGKLLFMRRGDRIEIRCPRSKALYALEWQQRASGGSGPDRPGPDSPN